LGWAAACSSTSATSANPDGGGAGSEAGSGGSGRPSDGGGSSDAGDGASALGLLVDNMTATVGTQVSMTVPAGDTPGSYYVYSDYPAGSMTIGTAQLVDVPVSPAVTNADGSEIIGKLCLGGGTDGLEAGVVVNYAGLGMSLVYGAADAAPPGCSGSPPFAFDASHYSGVSFYILVAASDASAPSIHFGVPDTQTADPCSVPIPACADNDAGCYDDFGSDITFTPGVWSKVSFTWEQLTQQNWGAQYNALKTNQLIGMKWQVNGPGPDASAEPFQFCISDIYFTP
jgi:hypothetical protein